jgi:hypothetical protein
MSSLKWRAHQQEVYKRGRLIAARQDSNSDTFTEVVPGGGKSRNVSILAEQLRSADLIRGIVWITPRVSLQAQAVEAAREGSGHQTKSRSFYLGDSFSNPRPDGFATNFSALLQRPGDHLKAIRRIPGPILLVADEVHFIKHYGKQEDFRGWSEVFAALRKEVMENSGHQLSMTGTARRWDESPVVNAPYDPLFRTHLDRDQVIFYDREEGLSDGAIVRIQPQFFDGTVQWDNGGVSEPAVPAPLSSFGAPGGEKNHLVGRALQCFLSKQNLDYVHMPVIWDAISRPGQGWLKSKKIYGNNQIIILADRRDTAAQIVNRLNSLEYRNKVKKEARTQGVDFNDEFTAVLAISSSQYASAAVASFRKGRLTCDMPESLAGDGLKVSSVGRSGKPVHCLVTVAMASVGMDAPMATHLVNLGLSRSIPWLTQAFARVWRSGSYKWPKGRKPVDIKNRMSYIWMPSDVRMTHAFRAICDGSYLSGISENQKSEMWHDLSDPADEALSLQELEDRDPVEVEEGASGPSRRKYPAVLGSNRITSISSHPVA